MNTYVPNTTADQQVMLRSLGADSIEDLLQSIPKSLRLNRPLNLPPGASELELRRILGRMAAKNSDLDRAPGFLGAGIYDHYIPAVVPHLVKRSEFYTSYTPYQPEVSQGILQAIYEFQTLMCQLTGLDIANASLYDGSTAVAEAAQLAVGPTGRGTVVISRAVDPQYRALAHTYAHARGYEIKEVGFDQQTGATDLKALDAAVERDTAAVIIQQPNFFGALEDTQAIEAITHKGKALFVVAISEPFSLGVLEAPGHYGADLAVGEGMALGNPVSYGGPGVGFFAARNEYMRRMPGRLAGKTVDTHGQTGYVLTLQTREQHIRRERATSNICTNQALVALAATVYLASVGKAGFQDAARQSLQKAHYAYQRISEVPGFQPAFTSPFFDEFAMRCPMPVRDLNRRLIEQGFIGGYGLDKAYPELENVALFCVTETRTRDEIDQFVDALARITQTAGVAGG
ncbi:MAG TPA: aminomethyl-transferring glycine dehydrogenase subunit GcvPA [Ktedonobacterales bacterium]|jgi:glycine dehydrogenase subunit 1